MRGNFSNAAAAGRCRRTLAAKHTIRATWAANAEILCVLHIPAGIHEDHLCDQTITRGDDLRKNTLRVCPRFFATSAPRRAALVQRLTSNQTDRSG